MAGPVWRHDAGFARLALIILAVMACAPSCATAEARGRRRWQRASPSRVGPAGTRRLTHDDLVTAAEREPTVLDVMRRQCLGEELEGEAVVDNKDAASSCHMLGRYREDEGAFEDAALLYARACDRGTPTACTDVALLAHDGAGVRGLLPRACGCTVAVRVRHSRLRSVCCAVATGTSGHGAGTTVLSACMRVA